MGIILVDRCFNDCCYEADGVEYEVDEAAKEGWFRSNRSTNRDRGERNGDGTSTGMYKMPS